MSAPTGLVSFRPNLFHNYHNPSERVPFRPGVFQGYQVKPWYISTEKEPSTDGSVDDGTTEGDVTE